MFTLRCTQRLRDRLGLSTRLPDVTTTTTLLGDWYANLLVRRPALVLCVNETTRLSVVLRLTPTKTLYARLRESTGEVLRAIGVDAGEVDAELREMALTLPGATRNRSILGTMNDFEQFIEIKKGRSLLDVSLELADVISLAMATTPRRATLEVFRSHPERMP